MTKRATYIKRFVNELVDLASNGSFIRKHALKPISDTFEDLEEHKRAKECLERITQNLQGCMAEICENNPEQAESLMADLGIGWDKSVPPEQTN